VSEYLTTSDRAFTAPAAANSIALAHPGAEYGDGPWVEILAAAPAGGAYLTDIILRATHYSAYTYNQEVDVGVGPAGSEAVIGTFRSMASTSNYGANFDAPLPVWIDAIPAGARLAVRLRSNRTSFGSNVVLVALSYVAKPLVGERLSTTRPYKCYPSNAGAIAVQSAADWESSAWAEIIGSTPADWLLMASWIVGASCNSEGTTSWDVGLGAAGSEEVIGTYRLSRLATTTLHPRPFYPGGWVLNRVIPAGSRLALRTRGDLDAPETNAYGWIHYVEAPL
jgi:hypothetical protein